MLRHTEWCSTTNCLTNDFVRRSPLQDRQPRKDRQQERATLKPYRIATSRERPSSYECFRVGARKITPGVVTVRVGTEIATAGAGVRAKDSLSEQSRSQIEAMLARGGVSADSTSGGAAPLH
jgi:hypothetical protein